MTPVRASGAWRAALLVGALQAYGGGAQEPSPSVDGVAMLESEPLRCWLKSTKTSVHVGEQFEVALTCAVVEAARAAVVPDVSRIEPGTIDLAPFEVLGGRRHPDVKRGIWRYFQYEYTVRLIADGFFGEDLAVPPISFGYRVNMLGAGVAQEGRERTYVLPQLPIRVVSLVPSIASDIRDSARDTFARIAERNAAANAAFGVAGILYAFAAVLTVLLFMRAFGAERRRGASRDSRLPATAVASAALAALGRVRAARSREGWTPALVTEAAALARIAGALALEQPVAQQRVAVDAVAEDGQLLAVRGVLERRAVLVSAPVTPPALARHTGRVTWPDRRPLIAEIGRALVALGEARYTRAGPANDAELDAALARVAMGLERARLLSSWPVRVAVALHTWWRKRGFAWTR